MPDRYSLMKARDDVIYVVIEYLAAQKLNEIQHASETLAHLEYISDRLDESLRDYTLLAFDLATGKGEK